MIETRGFTGKLNTDDNEYRVPNGDYVAALNITRDSQGAGQDEVVANIPGNQSIPILSGLLNSASVGTSTTTTLSFSGSALPLLTILVRIYNGSTYTTLSTYTTSGHSSIAQITAGLLANAVTIAGISYSSTSTSFLVTFNNTTYQSVSFSITNIITGTNKVIGNYADRVKNRQYYFTWNSDGYNTINYYDANNNVVVNLITDKTDTGGVSVLNFNPSYRINHIDIIYRDEGDLLFWTDGLNPPRKLNVATALVGGYGTIISSYLDVAKEPPSNPPYCTYYDDVNITINNLNNKLFKFKYRFVFDDLEKSVTSAQCEVPIPKNYSSQSVATDPTKNNNIFIVLDTGANNVKKIEILGSESLGETWSDFFLIDVLDKSLLNIADNDITSYRFYNNQAYNTIPLQESIQPFDIVPQKAYTQSLPNGNVLDYGAITENYDLIKQISAAYPFTLNTLYVNQTGIIVSSNCNATQVKIIAGGQFTIGDNVVFNIYLNGVYSTYSFTVSATNASGTVQAIYNQIKSLFVANGYIVFPSTITSTTNYLVIGKTSSIVQVATPTIVYPAQYNSTAPNSRLAYDWFSRYSYGVVYFDEKGRTNGVITALTSTIESSPYFEYSYLPGITTPEIPNNILEIYNRPPLWASYYEIVRTQNLTKSNFLYWLSYRTYKDDIPNQLGQQYAYISISNLTNYLLDNPSVKTISYEFVPGDRIRFVKLYDGSGNAVQIYNATDNRDYQIIESVTSPTINGVVVPGQVIKILLPSTSTTTPVFDFGGDTYANYLIELYTPTVSFSDNNNIYYEFGERYQIFNAGTVNAYHQGMTQNQSVNLVTPAAFAFDKGDSYYRYRKFPREGFMRWRSESYSGSGAATLNSYLYSNTNNNPYISPESTINLFVPGNPSPPVYHAVNINTSKVFTFFITGTVVVVASVNTRLYVSAAASNSPSASPASVFSNFVSSPVVAGQETTISYSLQITNTLGHNQLSHFLDYSPGGLGLFNGTIKSWTFEITINNGITQGIIDPNFSDFYDSAASPNGRAWRVDPNAKQTFNPTLIRFGGEFQAGTTINNINRFYEQNFDTYDRSRGAIKKMFIEGRNQYIFQEFDVGVVTVLTQIVRDTAGNPLSAQSDVLLNKIVYPYIGQYGIGNVPESFAYGKHAKYFVDNNKGVVCRLAADGITALSIVYKVNNFFVEKLLGFKTDLNLPAPSTGTPTVYGAFDAYTNKYIIALDEINNATVAQQAYTFAFLESRKANEGFEGELSFHPENIGDLNNLFISFKDGQPWTHNSNIYNNFYAIQYSSYIDVVFNDSPLNRKTFLSLMETANAVWYCPSIQSQLNSYGSTPQLTSLSEARFALLEGQYQSAILRDANSPGGIINGDTMHGNYLKIRFQKDSASNFYYLNTVSLVYNNSPLNLR